MSNKALNWVWKMTDLTQRDTLVLLALADAADEKFTCFPSVSAVADRARMSARSVYRILGSLERRGLLSRHRRERDDHSQTSSLYILAVNSVPDENVVEFKRRGFGSG